MASVEIHNPGPTPRGLPKIHGAPMDGGRRRPLLFGPMLLRPGTARVPSAHWEAVKNHPLVAIWLREGMLIEAPSKEQKAEKTPHTGGQRTIRGISIPKAEPLIAAETDRKVLLAWRNADNRAGILKSIDDRFEELDEGDDDTEG